MKILFVTDTHLRSKFKHGNEPDTVHGTLGLKRIAQSLGWTLALLEQERPDLFVFGGDLMDKSAVDYLSFSVAVDFLRAVRRFMGRQDAIHILRGNHDIASSKPGDHALHAISDLAMIHTDPATVEFDDLVVRMVPYVEREALQKHASVLPKADLGFAHVGIQECIHANGLAFGDFVMDDFNAACMFGGHYHKPSEYYGGRFIYTGALLPKDFSDASTGEVLDFGATIITARKATAKRWSTFKRLRNPHAATFLKLDERQIDLAFASRYQQHVADLYLDVASDSPLEVQEKLSRLYPYLAARVCKIRPKQEHQIEALSSVIEDADAPNLAFREQAYIQGLLVDYAKQAHIPVEKMGDYIEAGRGHLAAARLQDTSPLGKGGYSVLSVQAEGFLSIRREASLTIRPGIYIVEGVNNDDGGSNGAGKSTVFEAIYFALFGATVRDIDKLDDVVNNRRKVMRVEVVLQARGSEQRLKIERHRNHKIHGNNTKISASDTGIMWTDISKKKAADNEALIASLIGIDPALYRSTVLMSPHSSYLTHGTEGSRSEALLAFLDLGFDQAQESIKQMQADNLKRIDSLNGEKSAFLIRKSNQEVKLQTLIDSDILEGGRVESIELKTNLNKLQSRLNDDLDVLNKAVPSTKDLEEEIKSAQEIQKKLASTHIEAHTTLQVEMSSIRSRLLSSLSILNVSNCPTCGANVKVEDVTQERAKLEGRLIEIQASIASAAATHKATSGRYDEQIKAAQTALKQINALLSERQRIQGRVDGIRSQIKQTQDLVLKSAERLAEIQANIAFNQAKLDEVKAREWGKQEEMDTILAQQEILAFWRSAFSRSGLPKFLLSRVIEYANKRIAVYLNILLHGAVEAQFSVDKKGVALDATRYGVPLPYRGLSDGQRSCVDVATQFALHDVAKLSFGGLDILIIDEAVAYLDMDKAERVIDLMRAKIATGGIRTVFFASQRDHSFRGSDTRTLRAILSDGATKYEEM